MGSWPENNSWPDGNSWPDAGPWPSGGAWPVSGPAPPDDPIVIFGSNLLSWIRTDLGTSPGSCLDQSGNAVDWTQGTGGAQPVLAADPTLITPAYPGGMVTALFDGVDDVLQAALNRPAPNVEATSVFAVFKPAGWTSSDAVYGTGVSQFALRNAGVSPQMNMANVTGVNLSSGAPIGTWIRSCQIWTGSTSDLNHLGAAAAVTGGNAGTTDPGATFSLGARTTANFWNGYIAEFFIVRGAVSVAQRSRVDAYMTAWSGGVVTI